MGTARGQDMSSGIQGWLQQLSVEVPDEEWTWIDKLEGTHSDVTTGKHFFLEEAEGTFHVQTIPNLPYQTTYQVVIEVVTPFGSKKGNILEVTTPPEPCRDATVPDPVKFVESTENSLKVHLVEWKDANCLTDTFIVLHRQGDAGFSTIRNH